jgi:hypothetical protein
VNLTIGLLHKDAGWERLLTQIGVSWKLYDASQTLSPDAFAVMIVNAEPTTLQRSGLAAYVHAGGSVLADNGTARFFLDCRATKKKFTSFAPGSCGQFAPSSILDINTSGSIITSCAGKPVKGGPVAQIMTHGDGTVVSVSFPVSPCILSTESGRKNFYAPSPRLPSETVSTVSKGSIRQLVTNILEYLHHKRSLPFVHTWYYPGGHPSVFTFRVDTDKGNETELRELYEVCAKHGIPGTWFVDVHSHERWLDFFSSFAGQEIGLHCYRHETAAEREAVSANFGKGCRLLREAGFSVNGASAPCGTWNEAVDSVYTELGMAYSSEFSLDYDDMPFFPETPSGISRVMQLPIHPICVGSMKRSGYTSRMMREYFRTAALSSIASREPVCFYHHPTHHNWDVFDDMFTFITEMNLPKMTYSAYAAWWRQRIAVMPRFVLEGDSIVVANAADMSGELYYRVALPGREEIITQIGSGSILPDAPRVRRAERAAIPDDILRARKFDPRHPLINFLDYWYKSTE